ncbi:DUF3108 domain-containing protein [Variovorax sp. YR752]|uniref:DUF3108 domain-containing protein n=1 Tax=Variovorax sp. YR752 TaxID=1884383 RepID=UPI0031380D02
MLAAGADTRRRRALAALALAALAAHGLLIGGVELAPARHEAPAAAMALQVRTIAAAAPAAPAAPEVAGLPTPAPAPRPRPAPPPERRATPANAEPARGEVREAPAATEPGPEPLPAANTLSLPLPVEGGPAASAAGAITETAAPPLYPTRLPPPVMLRYELRRGHLSGSGDLLWRPDGDRYELRLQGSVVGVNVLTQVSGGALDANGLAPLRFTDQRARRAAVAANFEREAGRIRFSGPSHEVPWQPGVQDRLSWMVQLAAVAAAEPARLAEGERIVLQVVGARGDASLWAFRSEGAETLMLFSERIETVKLLREPRSAHDTRVEVWLDPARHHLPVRATLGSGEDDRLELRLREMLP